MAVCFVGLRQTLAHMLFLAALRDFEAPIVRFLDLMLVWQSQLCVTPLQGRSAIVNIDEASCTVQPAVPDTQFLLLDMHLPLTC